MFGHLKKLLQWVNNVGALEKQNKVAAYEQHLRHLIQHDPRNLQLNGYGVFSQNDEDGIIQEIFRRIGITNKLALEIAVGSGVESNTHLLLATGWNCVWFETNLHHIEIIKTEFKHFIRTGNLKVFQKWITPSNIENVLSQTKVPKQFDLLCLDIDGQEYWLWDAINHFRPRVVVVEFNAALGPDVTLVVPKNDSFVWDQRSMYWGASLKAFCILAERKGYSLVGCNYTGVNAFFVQTKLMKKHFKSQDVRDLFQKPNYGGYVRPGYLRTSNVWEQVVDSAKQP